MMTRCNYHTLQDTYKMLEEQLSVMTEKVADLKLNLEVSELDIDLDNLEAQLVSIAEKLGELDLHIDIGELDVDLDNLEAQLNAISTKMDELSLNVVIDSVDRSILLNIENRLTNIDTRLNEININVVGEINSTSNKISKLTEQLKIANQIALLKELDGVSAETKQNQYEAIKDLLFDADDAINQPSMDDIPNPIIDGGQG
jgi:hypothetical protein